MKFLRRSLTGLFLVSLTVGFLSLAGWMLYSSVQIRMNQEAGAPPVRERVFAVNVVSLVSEDISPILSTYGELRSRRTLDLRATTTGTIVELAESFVDGGRVEAGSLLIKIDPAEAQSELSGAEADQSEAQAELRDADRALILAAEELSATQEQAALRRNALVRQKDLLDRGVGSAANVETAELAAASANQSVVSRRQAIAQAEARVDLAKSRLLRQNVNLTDAMRRLADTEIYAAFSGTLSDVSVVEGGLVSNNERLGQLIDPDQLEVSFRVSTTQYARLLADSGALPELPVKVFLDAAGIDLFTTGNVSRESAGVGEGQTGRLLFARLAEARGFRPGDFVTVELREPELKGVSRLPATAIDASEHVLVLGEDDRLEEFIVTLLRREKDDVIVLAPNLESEEIVAERSPLLGAGIKVKPIRASQNENEQAMPETISLTDERRAELRAYVEANVRIPEDAKARILSQLDQEQVPAKVVARLEARMGG